jgi:hypothetical protein
MLPAGRASAHGNHLLAHLFGQFQQSQPDADGALAQPQHLRQFAIGEAAALLEVFQRARLVDGARSSRCKFSISCSVRRGVVVDVLDDARDFGQSNELRGAPASLARHNLVGCAVGATVAR